MVLLTWGFNLVLYLHTMLTQKTLEKWSYLSLTSNTTVLSLSTFMACGIKWEEQEFIIVLLAIIADLHVVSIVIWHWADDLIKADVDWTN